MQEEINKLFRHLLNPDTSIRNLAETKIQQISSNPSFEETILSIINSNLHSFSSVNLLQSIYLKNYVYQHLNPFQKSLDTKILTFSLKDVYLQIYYSLTGNSNESYKIKHNINLIIVRIAEFLYPNGWPTLIDRTTSTISMFNTSNPTEDTLQGLQSTLYILKGIFTYYLEDNRDADCGDEALKSSNTYLTLLTDSLKVLTDLNIDSSIICISLICKCLYRISNQITLEDIDFIFLKGLLQKKGADILDKDPYPLTQLICSLIENNTEYIDLVNILEQILNTLEINNKTLLYITLFISRFEVKFNTEFLRKIFERFINVEREDFKEIYTFFKSNSLEFITGEHSLYNIISNDKIELESVCLDKALKMAEYQLASAIIRSSSLLDGQFSIESIKEQIEDVFKTQESVFVKLSHLDVSFEILSKSSSVYLSLGTFILEVTQQNSADFLSAFIAVRYCSHITFNAENFALIFNFYSFLNTHLLFMVCFSAVYPRFLALNLVNDQQKSVLEEVNFLNVLNLDSLKVLPLICNDFHKVIESLLKANLFSLDNLTLNEQESQYLTGQLKTIVKFIKEITEQDVREYCTALTAPVFCYLGEILCILITHINKIQSGNNIEVFEETNSVFVNFLVSNKVELEPGYTSIIQCLAHLNSVYKLQNTGSLNLIYANFSGNWEIQKGQLRLLKVASERLNFNDLIANENVQKLINTGLEDIHLLSEVLSLSLLLVMKMDDPMSFTISIIKAVVDFLQKENNKHTHKALLVNIALLYFARLLNLVGIQKLNEMMENVQSGLFQNVVVNVWLPNLEHFKCGKKMEFNEFLKGTGEVLKSFNEGNEKVKLYNTLEMIKNRGAKLLRSRELVKDDECREGEGGEFYDLKTSCVK